MRWCSDIPYEKSSLKTLRAIVKHYQKFKLPKEEKYLRYFRISRTLAEAIERAALAKKPNGKRHSHQRRIPQRVLDQFHELLLQAHLNEARSFIDLYNKVKGARIEGIGRLTTYDTAHRVGAYLGLRPTAVYLHAGVRVGAKALGLDHRARTIPKKDLPKALQVLRPEYVEDCLCIYKRELQGIAEQRTHSISKR